MTGVKETARGLEPAAPKVTRVSASLPEAPGIIQSRTTLIERIAAANAKLNRHWLASQKELAGIDCPKEQAAARRRQVVEHTANWTRLREHQQSAAYAFACR